MGQSGCHYMLVETTILLCVISQNRADPTFANVGEEVLQLHVKYRMWETRLLNVRLILTTFSAFSGHLNFQFF
jgi:hypothetical protein